MYTKQREKREGESEREEKGDRIREMENVESQDENFHNFEGGR